MFYKSQSVSISVAFLLNTKKKKKKKGGSLMGTHHLLHPLPVYYFSYTKGCKFWGRLAVGGREEGIKSQISSLQVNGPFWWHHVLQRKSPRRKQKNTKANSINWLFKTPVSPTSSQRDQTSSMMNTGIILQLITSLWFAFEEPPLSSSISQYFSGLPSASMDYQGHWLLILRGLSG